MYDKSALITWSLSQINATDAVSPEDVAWCATIAKRREPKQDGLLQLGPLITACVAYNAKKTMLTPYDDYVEQEKLAAIVFALKATVYRQRRVLIACPQRKQHLPDGQNPPNLGGLVAPQAVRVEADACYGLDHIESRNYFVRKAIASNVYSHVLFVDEDMLLPLNALTYLLSLNLSSVGLNYVKKTPILESIATEIVADTRDIWRNESVSAEDPTDLTPRPVNCLGLGALLVDVDVFRRIPEPWFKFEFETNPDGTKGRIMLGEDSHFCRQMFLSGIKTYIIPGMVAPHCDFKTGGFFGPRWLCDPLTRTIRPEHVANYTHFDVDPKTLWEPDNSDVFDHLAPKKAVA